MDVKKEPGKRKNVRKAAVKRRRKRRLRKYTLYYLIIILFAAAAGVALSLTVFFKIESVSVIGNTRYANGEIIVTGGIEIGENLIRLDTDRAAEAIEAAYPYVKKAQVRRSLPSEVIIEIEMAVPDAALRYSQGYMLITREGRVLEAGLGALPEGFVQIIGIEPGGAAPGMDLPQTCKEQLVMLNYLSEALGEVSFEQLDLIDVGDRLDIKLLYQNRLILRLGSESDLTYKLKFSKTIIETRIDDNFIGVLNAAEGPPTVRYRNIFTSEVWPFGEELLLEYSGRPSVVGAIQSDEPTINVDEPTNSDWESSANEPA